MQFERPIPGESLTTTPKGASYEIPPEVTDPYEAIERHLVNLTEDGAMEDIMFFLEQGVDLQTLTEGILRSAVMEGIHSIDVSLIIGPVIFEFIRGVALRGGVDFNEGLDDPETQRAIMVKRDEVRAAKILGEMKIGGKKATDLMSLEDTEVAKTEEPVEEMPMEETEESPAQGLMARRMA